MSPLTGGAQSKRRTCWTVNRSLSTGDQHPMKPMMSHRVIRGRSGTTHSRPPNSAARGHNFIGPHWKHPGVAAATSYHLDNHVVRLDTDIRTDEALDLLGSNPAQTDGEPSRMEQW